MNSHAMLLAFGTVLAVGALRTEAQIGTNPADSFLVVYHLDHWVTPLFDHTDRAMSPFWDQWGRDSIVMTVDNNRYPGRDSTCVPGGAELTVKAAANGQGLYLYFGVADDRFIPPESSMDWGADALSLYLDNMSTYEMDACNWNCFVGLYSSSLTYWTHQYNVWIGTDTLPGIYIQEYDENVCMGSFLTRVSSVQQAEQRMGILMDWCVLDSTRRAHEWFIPWRSVGRGGIPEGTRLAGKMLGFSGGYNDKDDWLQDACCLRWIRTDPWALGANAEHPFGWANLVMHAFVPHVGPQTKVRPGEPAATTAGKGGLQVRHYNLRGQAIVKAGLRAAQGIRVSIERSAPRVGKLVLGCASR